MMFILLSIINILNIIFLEHLVSNNFELCNKKYLIFILNNTVFS